MVCPFRIIVAPAKYVLVSSSYIHVLILVLSLDKLRFGGAKLATLESWLFILNAKQ